MEVAAMRSASVLSFSFYFNGKENSMTKFAILGAAVVFFALARPAIAQHSVANPSYIVETGVCPGHEPEIPIPSRRITSPGAPAMSALPQRADIVSRAAYVR